MRRCQKDTKTQISSISVFTSTLALLAQAVSNLCNYVSKSHSFCDEQHCLFTKTPKQARGLKVATYRAYLRFVDCAMSQPLQRCTGLCCAIIGLVVCIAGFATSSPGLLFGTTLTDLTSYSNAVKAWPSDLFAGMQPSLSATVGTGAASPLQRTYGLQNEASSVNVPSFTLTMNGQTQQWTYSSSLHGIQFSASVATGLSSSFYISYGAKICNVTLSLSTAQGQFLRVPLCPLLFDQSSNTAYKLASVCVAASATGGNGGLYVNPSRRGCMWPQSSAASLAPKLPAAEGAVIAADGSTGLVMAQYVRQSLYSEADFSSLRVTVKGVNDPYLLATSLTDGDMDLDPSPGLGGRFAAFGVGIAGAVLLAIGVIVLGCVWRRRRQGGRMWSLQRGSGSPVTVVANPAAAAYISVAGGGGGGGGPMQQQAAAGRQQANVVQVLNPVSAAAAAAAAGYPYGYAGSTQQQQQYGATAATAPASAPGYAGYYLAPAADNASSYAGRPPPAPYAAASPAAASAPAAAPPSNALAPLANAYAAGVASGLQLQRSPPSMSSFDGLGSDPKMMEAAHARAALGDPRQYSAAAAAAAGGAGAGSGSGYLSTRVTRFGMAPPIVLAGPAVVTTLDEIPYDTGEEDDDPNTVPSGNQR